MHRKVEQNNGTDCAIYTIEYFKEALNLFLKMDKDQTKKKFDWWAYLIKECNKNKKMFGYNVDWKKSRENLAIFLIKFVVLF
jgi:hypothetical protein